MSSVGLKITNFHYSNTVFDKPKTFVEFPKWIHREGKPSVLAQNAQEEAELLGGNSIPQTLAEMPVENFHPSAPVLSGPNDEREILLQIAKEKNITIDNRWGTKRIRSTIERETQNL